MKKTKLALFGLAGAIGVGAAIGASQLGGAFKLGAAEVNTWKHFSAIMPTEDSKGIREYWTDCVGGAPQFTAPEGITAADATLTDEQKAYILNHAGDERVIPTLSEIQRSVSKGYDGKTDSQGYDVATAYGYTYLDETTKALVSGAVESEIVSAYETYNARFTALDLAVTWDSAPGYQDDGAAFKANEVYFDDYGLAYEMISGKTNSGWICLTYGDADFDLTGYESISFYVYNPTDTAWAGEGNNSIRIMNDSSWAGVKTYTVAAHSWGKITIDKSWFDTNTGSKFASWCLGVVAYAGYESATETLKISKPVARKIAASAAEFDDAVAKISSITNPTKADAWYIKKAGELLTTLSEDAKQACNKLDDYNTAKANCSYTIAGLIDASTFVYTAGWGAAGTASNIEDDDYGEILKINVTATGGAMESAFSGITVDSSSYDTVTFYVKADWNALFCLSKNDWWRSAYDFAAKAWVATGQDSTFTTGTDGWVECTMSAEDFNLCKYYSFFNTGAVGNNFYISPFYLSNSAQ